MPISSDLDLGTPDTKSKPRILGISGSSSTNISNLDEFSSLCWAWASEVVTTPNKAKEKRQRSKTLSMVFILGCTQVHTERDHGYL